MSFHHFIMNILNIKFDMIETLDSIAQSDNSTLIKVKLIKDESIVCPFCKGLV